MKYATSRSWTPEQDALLKMLAERDASATRAAAALKRSIVAVRGRARKFGLKLKGARDYRNRISGT
jgi:hypothetical protein